MAQPYIDSKHSAKQISSLVFTRYTREPINYLYINGSTKPETKSIDDFRFEIIGVALGLQAII
jgi:hypothetical protein